MPVTEKSSPAKRDVMRGRILLFPPLSRRLLNPIEKSVVSPLVERWFFFKFRIFDLMRAAD
jgi:hypothetical protein